MSHWTKEETQIAVDMKNQGKSNPEIATVLNRSPKAVRDKLGYIKRSKKAEVKSKAFWTPEEKAKMRRLHDLGMNDKKIGARLGRTGQAVRSMINLEKERIATAKRMDARKFNRGSDIISGRKPELIQTRLLGGCRYVTDQGPCGAHTEGRFCPQHATIGFDRPDKAKSDHFCNTGVNNFGGRY